MFRRFRNLLNCLKSVSTQQNALDQYVTSQPTPQNILDIFKGEWTSKLPGHLANLSAGSIPLFDDHRIEWCIEQVGGIEGKTVLELGPLEAGHTYMLERFGASSILSIEANSHSYLKCLIIKELLGLKRARFLLGDFVEFLHNNREKFDVCLAFGVLYHMINPIELIALIAKATDHVCLWTHYYDHEIISKDPGMSRIFSNRKSSEYAGFKHKLYHRVYDKKSLGFRSFCGGAKPFSYWLSREDIINSLKYFGLTEIEIGFDEPNCQDGPGFSLVAFRK